MEFRILGPLEVLDDGRPVAVERRRMRALLAFLLLHANEPVSTDRLVDEVWGPEPPKTAGASLQNYVSRLRRTIGADAILSQAGAYVLRVDPERFDLARFERLTAEARGADAPERAQKLRAALALWRGPALDELAYEPFARDEVGRLEEARLAALEECIDAELELGRTDLGELEQLVEQHPLRERFRAQLMRALYRAGRQADALVAFQAGREVLREELGLDPGEELRALQQAILRQDPALGPSAPRENERPADRRTVTVLRCDLVDSARLAAQLDPEAYRSLMSRYFELVRTAIEHHGGTLEKFAGDAVLAVFGVPVLHEDDALRAVRAAVEAQSSLRADDIAARIGISSGEMHVLSAEGEPMHVSGAPASIASGLEERAPPGEILVSGATYALVRDAVRAERAGDAWRVVEVVPGASGYARRLDAPFVGRAEELERLRVACHDAWDSAHGRVVTVVGEAGIGKTRLMRELVQPLRAEARILVGRCASYGEGATYLPIAEIVRQAAPTAEGLAALLAGEKDAERVVQRVAEVTGIAEGPAVPGEAFWAVRRFVEAVARERPLVLVFDDIHWAEPTLLDLIEYLGEWTAAPVLVLCAARGDLLENRTGWGGPTSTGFLVALEPLATAEMEELVAGLADQAVDPAVTQRVLENAGGNPLFAEQLLALAAEAPGELAETPPDVEALIASRLDRLDPRDLVVLRRASVVGRRFTRPELADLTPPDETSQIDNRLAALAARALVHPWEHVFVFHHVLVRDVAYQSIPKAERAALHELAARGLGRREALDEVVGYHLEQAYRHLVDIGRIDDHADEVRADAAERVGRAGIRAWKRADVPAATNLLSRAVELAPGPSELACELGVVLLVGGHVERAKSLFAEVADASDERIATRARVELAHVRALSEPGRADELVEASAAAIPVLEAVADDRALGRAWLAVGLVRGGYFCEYTTMEDASARAVLHYRRGGWSPSTALSNLGAALFFGPRPVAAAVAQLEELLETFAGDRASEANLLMWLGGLYAMRGSLADARARVTSARDVYLQLGLTNAIGDDCARMLGLIESLAGNLAAAAEHFRASCESLQSHGQTQVLATRAGELAGVLCQQGLYDEAEASVRLAERLAGDDDLDAALVWQRVDALLLARAGAVGDAERRVREVLAMTPDDATFRRAEILVALGTILRAARRDLEASTSAATAFDLYMQKGNVAAAERLRPFVLETVV